MPAEYVPMVIDIGEDFTSDIIWTDEQDQPQNVVAPCQLDIRGPLEGDEPVISLETPVDIKTSTAIGLVQIHIPKEVTVTLLPGQYEYDLFVTVHDNELNVDQTSRLLFGPVTINGRITILEA